MSARSIPGSMRATSSSAGSSSKRPAFRGPDPAVRFAAEGAAARRPPESKSQLHRFRAAQHHRRSVQPRARGRIHSGEGRVYQRQRCSGVARILRHHADSPPRRPRLHRPDERNTQPVMIVNQSFAARFFRGQSPLGRKVRASGKDVSLSGWPGTASTSAPRNRPARTSICPSSSSTIPARSFTSWCGRPASPCGRSRSYAARSRNRFQRRRLPRGLLWPNTPSRDLRPKGGGQPDGYARPLVPGSGGVRTLQRHVLHGEPAHSRNRHSHGDGRPAA